MGLDNKDAVESTVQDAARETQMCREGEKLVHLFETYFFALMSCCYVSFGRISSPKQATLSRVIWPKEESSHADLASAATSHMQHEVHTILRDDVGNSKEETLESEANAVCDGKG